jgi:mono/diheme cytochrome c family protein
MMDHRRDHGGQILGRPHAIRFARAWSFCAPMLILAARLFAADPSSPAGIEFFERKIRPLLADHCYQCHSAKAEKLKGGLHLDSPEGLLKGGELGPAIIPGDPEKSLLIKAVRYSDPELQMPPKKEKLSDRQVADLAKWVELGAPWPALETTKGSPSTTAAGDFKKSDWWAFQPVGRPPPPSFKSRRDGNAIDAFVFSQLESKGFNPNPSASKRELIRRAYFDLIGLPPTPEQIAAFEKDESPDAWAKLIDHLLALPQYGERWARHWLDVVRFAQSNGYERDGEKPYAWRYRDYVVKALNEDKPYDQFIREQIAGDELDQVTFDSIIATGFQRLGVWDDEPDDKRMAEFDELDDVLSTTGTTFLGLSLGCARCHDHKFDPIPQADYYQLLSFFRNLRLNENARLALDSPSYVPLAGRAAIEQWQRGHETRLKPLQDQLAGAKNEDEKKKLSAKIETVKAERPPFEWALAVRERGSKPPPTHLLVRGNAGTPGAEVQPAFLNVLGAIKPSFPESPPEAASSGRRRVLAEWIANPRNPLTARVMVNRIWQHHFGRGIVGTTSDFGRAGTLPSHPKLLDWLAAEFMENGWSIKKLHKTILLSQTYRLSSRNDNPRALAADPGNDLLWRQNLRRLEAEAIRDTILSISGTLNLKSGGRGFFPHLGGEVLAGQSRPGLDWEISTVEEESRRTLYAYVRRTMLPPVLEAFDYNNTATPLSERPITTVAPQSLMLLNDEFLQHQAAAFALRLLREAGPTPESRVRRGFELAVGREATKREGQLAGNFLKEQEKAFNQLRSRLTFRPDVPNSLSVDYMKNLQPEHFLIGPRTGWGYHRGRWSGAYEGIRTVDRERGPFALWTQEAFTNGLIEAKVFLHNACESAGLFLRAVAKENELHGYEVALDPRQRRIALRRHDAEVTTLAEATVTIPTGSAFLLRAEATGSTLRVWLRGQTRPLLEVTDSKPLTAPGQIGVRAWGAALSVDDLRLQVPSGKVITAGEGHSPRPAERALQAFCLLLLNLNEVVYVD